MLFSNQLNRVLTFVRNIPRKWVFSFLCGIMFLIKESMSQIFFYKPKGLYFSLKARALFYLQKVIHWWWKNYCTKTHDVWVNWNTKETHKISCPQVYLKHGKNSIAIDLYYSMGGFYSHHK